MSLHQYVIRAAAGNPDAMAVISPAGALRYGDLDQQADILAAELAARGVGPGDRVLIWHDNSLRAVVAMQAVLRLGAAYVPASGMTPLGRIALMARDCSARVVCAAGDMLPRLSAELGAETRCLSLDELPEPGPAGVRPVSHDAAPGDLAYILYTSGSTGVPKGVCVSHANACAFIDWAVTELDARPADRFANHASFTFDLSVLDLYAAFAAGASVSLVPPGAAYLPGQLVQFLHDQQISIWYSVPSALVAMVGDGGLLDRPAPAALRAVLFAGEPFPISYVRRLAAWTSARLLNLYGPTETNVCTFHEVAPADLDRDRPVPIGAATSGSKVWAVRPDGSVARHGEQGELTVDGPTVMRGYWGREPQYGPYPTGDLARVLADGTFDYLGRKDHMVKVRGHRIELGEVEAALSSHPDVDELAVVTSGAGVDARLIACLAARPGTDPSVLGLRRHCAQRLPPYMIPDEIRFVISLPRTPNGKIDRIALASGQHRRAMKEEAS